MTGDAPGAPQGRCETTGTPRYALPSCACGTYAGNLGPCAAYRGGAVRRCVYCDHDLACHVALARLFQGGDGVRVDGFE